jgi:hypothetical protein
MVLLKEACTWAIPSTTVFFTFFFLIGLAIEFPAFSVHDRSARLAVSGFKINA